MGKRWGRDGERWGKMGKRWGRDGEEMGKRWGKMGKRWGRDWWQHVLDHVTSSLYMEFVRPWSRCQSPPPDAVLGLSSESIDRVSGIHFVLGTKVLGSLVPEILLRRSSLPVLNPCNASLHG
jgi:hypothetical protein